MGRAEFPRAMPRRGSRQVLQGLFLHIEVSFDISVGSSDIFMAKPESYDLQRDACLEQVHGGRVSPGMERDLASAQ